MIAASPDRYNSLQLFQLTLLLLRSEKSVPPNMRKEFMSILSQASQLAENPHTAMQNSVEIEPEAITLALMMRRENTLGKMLSGISTFDTIQPQLATQVLSHIESGVIT